MNQESFELELAKAKETVRHAKDWTDLEHAEKKILKLIKKYPCHNSILQDDLAVIKAMILNDKSSSVISVTSVISIIIIAAFLELTPITPNQTDVSVTSVTSVTSVISIDRYEEREREEKIGKIRC